MEPLRSDPSLKRPDSESLFFEMLIVHPKGLGVSSPKTICIDHCGYNFHFSIKVGRVRVIIRTSCGATMNCVRDGSLVQRLNITSRVRSAY